MCTQRPLTGTCFCKRGHPFDQFVEEVAPFGFFFFVLLHEARLLYGVWAQRPLSLPRLRVRKKIATNAVLSISENPVALSLCGAAAEEILWNLWPDFFLEEREDARQLGLPPAAGP